MKRVSIILEYPTDWNVDKNVNHRIFLNNLIKTIMNKDVNLTLIPAPWPTYGIKRQNLSKNLLLAFHAYNMPNGGWTYKESPIKGLYSIDRNGYSGWSDICINYEKYISKINRISMSSAKKIVYKYRDKIQNGMTKYDQDEVIEKLPDDYIFYALQVRTDSVAELTFLDSLDVLDKIAQYALEKKKYVVIKQHPWCKSSAVHTMIHNITATNPYIIVSNNDITKILANAKAVVAANSGVGLEALICGKPVISFGTSEWVNSTLLIKELDELNKIFDDKYYIQPNLKLIAFLLDQYWVPVDSLNKISDKINEFISDTMYQQNPILEPDIKYQNLVLDYQKKYTTKYNQLREVEADYRHLNGQILMFKKLLRLRDQLFYFPAFILYSIKRLFQINK